MLKTFKTLYDMILEHAATEAKELNESENLTHLTVSGDVEKTFEVPALVVF